MNLVTDGGYESYDKLLAGVVGWTETEGGYMQQRAMTELMKRQGKHKSHEVLMKDGERAKEGLRLRTTRYWFKPSDFRGWVRLTKTAVGSMPVLSVKKAKPVITGDIEVVVERMTVVLNKEGSATEVPWEMCAKFMGLGHNGSQL